MSYITSIERIGRREEQNEGILIGEIRLCQELLEQEPVQPKSCSDSQKKSCRPTTTS